MSIWNAKKQHPRLTFASQKTAPMHHSRPEQKMRLPRAPSISCCRCFPWTSFSFLSRFLSFLVLHIFDHPTHVMMLTRIRTSLLLRCFRSNDSRSVLKKEEEDGEEKETRRIKDRRIQNHLSIQHACTHVLFRWKVLRKFSCSRSMICSNIHRINMRRKKNEKFNVWQITIIKRACRKQSDEDDDDGENGQLIPTWDAWMHWKLVNRSTDQCVSQLILFTQIQWFSI